MLERIYDPDENGNAVFLKRENSTMVLIICKLMTTKEFDNLYNKNVKGVIDSDIFGCFDCMINITSDSISISKDNTKKEYKSIVLDKNRIINDNEKLCNAYLVNFEFNCNSLMEKLKNELLLEIVKSKLAL